MLMRFLKKEQSDMYLDDVLDKRIRKIKLLYSDTKTSLNKLKRTLYFNLDDYFKKYIRMPMVYNFTYMDPALQTSLKI